MASITDPDITVKFASAMEERHNNRLKTFGEILDTTTTLCQSHIVFMKSALDTCLKKCKEDEILFKSDQSFKTDLERKNDLLKEKRRVISDVMAENEQKEMQKDEIIRKIERRKEEQTRRKQLVESQNKTNKERLKNLQKAKLMFQEFLRLEIRTICGTTQQVKGEKLQFVFRNINPAHEDSAFVVTMGLKDDGSYQIVSSDPVLECLPVLERRLQETNNLPAFLANVRKEFISQVNR
ncbi:kinetochore protein Spc25 [Betta splendens]|uniref:Kinetochore protein SPC25 n=1 Tax=Betta splendens TaxID=158456 RepID=A0A6P7LH12_BETSP|nr:kinetochore protein Spc25 [Betta splendens]XP_028992945.1 kinetochore protein Spc25 [Betta splendens]